jgi:hypothetical protein
MLRQDTELLTREPTGVGLDVPAWLVALEDEVDEALRPRHLRLDDDDLEGIVPQVFLSQSEARRQLNRWANRQD